MAEATQRNKNKMLNDAARNAIIASGINRDEALASRLRDAKKQAEAGGEQHQKTMRVLTKTMSKLAPKRVTKSLRKSEQGSSGRESEDEAARAMAAPPNVATSEVTPVSESRKRTGTMMMRSPDRRQEKKVKAQVERTKQVGKETVRQPQKTVSPTAKNTKTRMEETPSVKETVRQRQNTASPPAKKDSNSKEKGTKSSEIAVVSSENTEQYTTLSELPGWYTSISMDSLAMKRLHKKRPPALATLESLKGLIRQCEKTSPKESRNLSSLFDKLRDAIHKVEITLTITPEILRKKNMLHPEYGLPSIFNPTANFPPDLKADSYQLYKRWSTGNLNQSLLRGIVSEKTHSRTSDHIDPDYKSQFSPSFKFIGRGHLVQGQWWPTQLCAVRDGAHGAPQGGICGSPDQGAYSIVLSSGSGYDDTDEGETIHYSGTRGSDGEATENTKHLLVSLETGHPVRVLRSAQLPKGNPYKPQLGLRYDGLYTVVDVKVLDEEKAIHRFWLERCKGQMGIRYQGQGARPTRYEIKEYERLKEDGA